MAENIKDLDNLKPIDHAVVAKPHTSVYKMHRYFARRPWSVFRALIEHYSNPGSIILDPFCGGGVTVIEGLRLGRKVIGVDLNPMATFITQMEAIDVDLDELKAAFEQVEAACREKIEELYLTTCPKCGEKVAADWFEWSKVYETPEHRICVVISECKKLRAGRYLASDNQHKEEFTPLEAKRLRDVMIAIHVNCPRCKKKTTFKPTEDDKKLPDRCEQSYEDIVRAEGLKIPDEAIPDMNMARENALFKRGITHFRDLFTKRNLIANGRLKKAILAADYKDEIRNFLGLAFSGSLRFTNNMVFRVQGWQSGKPVEWAKPAYWLQDVFIEQNVATAYLNRQNAIRRALKYTKSEIKPSAKHTTMPNLLKQTSAQQNQFMLITGSADNLPLPDASVDVIITDPPYGGNVQYLELSDFWVVWLHEWINVDGVTDKSKEAITTRHRGFEGAKELMHYRSMLHAVFKECQRVLKPHRWMVMTFHNKEFRVWNAIHLAAHDAGFKLAERDGMIYQPAIKLYEHTISTRRSGSMLGDFILSFQKVEKEPGFRQIEHAEIGRQIERLAAEAVIHHKGASLSLIYMKLMPWLLNNNLLDKISEKELVPYLTNSFEEKDGKWYLKANPGDELKGSLEEYSRQHYKASYEELDFVPVEARIEYLIRRLLYSRGFATQDDILNTIYENLINSNMADAREIQQVLSSIAKLVPISEAAAGKVSKGKAGRKVWKLKEDIEREKLWAELGADVQYRLATSEESDHDLAIARLVEMAGSRGLKAHIGKTEQMKYTEFRRNSSDLPQRVQGLAKRARDIIEQIDVLWHNGGKGIVAAFEVERTTTITSGIDRFRNLLSVMPESHVELYLVVPKSRGNELRSKLGSPANRKDGLHRKIGYIYLEDLKIRNSGATVDFEKIKRFINGGQE
jgi:putative DNA methylase